MMGESVVNICDATHFCSSGCSYCKLNTLRTNPAHLTSLQSLERKLAGGHVIVVALQALAEGLLVHVAWVSLDLGVLGRLPRARRERTGTPGWGP